MASSGRPPTSEATLLLTPDATGSVARPQIRLRVRIANGCGATETRPTTVAVCQCLDCPADYNQDGGIDGGDINAFFAAWESGGCDGDVNADGGVDSGDIAEFFAAWEAGGCCSGKPVPRRRAHTSQISNASRSDSHRGFAAGHELLAQEPRVALRHDRLADGLVVELLRAVDPVRPGTPAVWKWPMRSRWSVIVRITSPSMICMR
jgi:hypothetical protein